MSVRESGGGGERERKREGGTLTHLPNSCGRSAILHGTPPGCGSPYSARARCSSLPMCVTGCLRLRGLPLALVDSVVSRVAPPSGQNLVSVRDLYKQEATSEYSFGLVFFQSGMSSHSYLTRLAVSLRSALPPTDQQPAAAQRRAPPNSDGSEDHGGNVPQDG